MWGKRADNTKMTAPMQKYRLENDETGNEKNTMHECYPFSQRQDREKRRSLSAPMQEYAKDLDLDGRRCRVGILR